MPVLRAAAMSGALAGLAIVCALSSWGPVRAQDDDAALARRESELRARLTADPSDQGARCELGFVRVRRGDAAGAVAVLDPAIVALGAPPEGAVRRRLAACLYSRGRAREALGQLDLARRDYQRSLELRPHDSVRERLAALAAASPTPPATTAPPEARAAPASAGEVIDAALAACARTGGPGCELGDPRDGPLVTDLPAGACDDGTRWWIVRLVRDADFMAEHHYALVARRGGAITARELAYHDGWTAAFHPDGRRLGALGCGVVLRRTAAMPTRIPAEEGFAHDDGLHVAWLGDGRIVLVELSTDVLTEESEFALDARLDDAGALTVRRERGRVPEELRRFLGTHPLQSLPR